MLSLPERVPGAPGEKGKPIKTWLPDALHFQRAIQNVRVRDMEVEMPVSHHLARSHKIQMEFVLTVPT